MTVIGHSNVFRLTKIDGGFEKETIHLGYPPKKWGISFGNTMVDSTSQRLMRSMIMLVAPETGKLMETVVGYLGYQGDLLQKL